MVANGPAKAISRPLRLDAWDCARLPALGRLQSLAQAPEALGPLADEPLDRLQDVPGVEVGLFHHLVHGARRSASDRPSPS